MVVNRDGLSVLDGNDQIGVTISGTPQVYVDNTVVGSDDDFFVGQRTEPAQWCPHAKRLQVVDLPAR